MLTSGVQNPLYGVRGKWFFYFSKHLEHQLPRPGRLVPLSLQNSNWVLDHNNIIMGPGAKCNTIAISSENSRLSVLKKYSLNSPGRCVPSVAMEYMGYQRRCKNLITLRRSFTGGTTILGRGAYTLHPMVTLSPSPLLWRIWYIC